MEGETLRFVDVGRNRIRVGAVGAVALATVAMTLIGAAPAGASLVSPSNNLIIGSGAQVDYDVMQQLDTLFNDSPGCQLIATGTQAQPLDFSCPSSSNATFPPEANGQPEYGYTENPGNDVAVSEPAIGATGGISQLEDQGAHGTAASANVANNINYARSSRAPKTGGSGDDVGLNFVAFGKNAVSWFHFTEVGGQATPSANVHNLTSTQLQQIYSHTITNWDSVGGANAPIKVYSVPKSSGVDSTFSSFLGSGVTDPGTNANNTIVPQNEDAAILANGTTAAADAIIDYSVGTYNGQCKTGSSNCGGSPLPSGDTNALGSVNGAAPTQGNILNGSFPIPQILYNAYSNGSNTNIPAATPATLNYVSEDGFLCKEQRTPQGKEIDDPNTGVWYHTEIDNVISAAGFIPLPNGAPASGNTKPIDEGSVPHTALSLLSKVVGGQAQGAKYLPWDQPATANNGDPLGYCQVFTTDTGGGPS
jgi:ABC-type phosphate transport system substrate-binding protein